MLYPLLVGEGVDPVMIAQLAFISALFTWLQDCPVKKPPAGFGY